MELDISLYFRERQIKMSKMSDEFVNSYVSVICQVSSGKCKEEDPFTREVILI